MDFLSTKALTIAVGIAVSLTITSAILFTLNQITLIYKDVYSTDVSIKKQFPEFSMYDGTVMTGLQMYNTAKKFKDSKIVHVKYLLGANNLNDSTNSWMDNFDGSEPDYTSKLYNVNYTNFEDIITINFTIH